MVVFLALMQVAAVSEWPDDPGLAREIQAPRISRPAPPPVSDEPPGLLRLGLGVGWASPLVDPDVHEGFGASVDIALGGRLTLELRSSVGYNRYVDPLDNLGVQFISGDFTLGPGYSVMLLPGVRMAFFAGAGPAWMATWLGVNWSMGAMGGLGVEWSVRPWVGFRVEARYHLFHLTEIGGADFYDRKSLREVGPVDRFDLPVGIAFHL